MINRNTDQDFNGDGTISAGTLEDGNGEFFIGNGVPCFTQGSLITVPTGKVAVEFLREGDLVTTRDDGVQRIAWAGSKKLSGGNLCLKPHLQPVLTRAGALGNGIPEHDLMVSPNHQILLNDPKYSLYFGDREALVAAKHLD